ncbi:putative rRNA-processing protein EBP2, partial [Perkinsus olseni]
MSEASELLRKTECDIEKLNAALKSISYGVPQGLTRVPWIETLALTSTQEPISEKGFKPDDRVEIEKAMYSQAQESVTEAFRRFAAMGIEANRPDDFYAEMLKTDQQMGKIRENLADQQKRIEIVEERKRRQAEKKFGKKMQVAAAQARAAQKRENLAEIEK